MTQKRKYVFLLIALCVVLLFLVSARVGQEALDEETALLLEQKKEEARDPETELTEPIETEELPPPEEEEEEPWKPEIRISDWPYKLVNQTHVLSSSFAPNVTEVADGQYFDTRAADALTALLDAAHEAGYSTCVRAAYRPYSSQAYLFFGKASQIAWDGTVPYPEAEDMARSIVAYPGTSDHQTGLAADIMDRAETVMAAEDVADLPLLKWLKEHCAEYGFILRFPEEKQEITGWYEPWHFRYVGEEAASYIMENGLCLEEFVDLY